MRIQKAANFIVLPFVVALALTGCFEPSDERPADPKAVRTKYIDPESRKCAKWKRLAGGGRTCTKWDVDDLDYVIVTSDGAQYDVDKEEYDKVTDRWPVL